MDSPLAGQVAVVADPTTLTGTAVVSSLLQAGARVVTARRVTVDGPSDLLVVRDDVPEGPRDVEALVDHAVTAFGRVDVLVLSGGEPADVHLADLAGDDWAAASGQLDRVFWGLRAGVREMIARGTGRIVVTVTSAAKVGRAGAGAATMLDHAAYGLVKVAAKEAGPQGVTVNAVIANHHPEGSVTGRTTKASETAAAVLLLASPAGGGISGTGFPVDGGVAPY